MLGEVPPVSPYYEGVRCEARVCRPVAGVPGATQHLYHIAAKRRGNDTVPFAGLRLIGGYHSEAVKPGYLVATAPPYS